MDLVFGLEGSGIFDVYSNWTLKVHRLLVIQICSIHILSQVIEVKLNGLIIRLLCFIQDFNNKLVAAVLRIFFIQVRENLLVIANWHYVRDVSVRYREFLN